jgi:HEPN domain-containing protein
MYQDEKYPNARKYTILAVYQAVELFLKDALYRINPVLIYSDIDKRVHADSRTVGFKEAAQRLENSWISP